MPQWYFTKKGDDPNFTMTEAQLNTLPEVEYLRVHLGKYKPVFEQGDNTPDPNQVVLRFSLRIRRSKVYEGLPYNFRKKMDPDEVMGEAVIHDSRLYGKTGVDDWRKVIIEKEAGKKFLKMKLHFYPTDVHPKRK
jgi:hypothetical protein